MILLMKEPNNARHLAAKNYIDMDFQTILLITLPTVIWLWL
jgi:hypothetical protein